MYARNTIDSVLSLLSRKGRWSHFFKISFIVYKKFKPCKRIITNFLDALSSLLLLLLKTKNSLFMVLKSKTKVGEKRVENDFDVATPSHGNDR